MPNAKSLIGLVRPEAHLAIGEPLTLPFMNGGQPILAVRGRWADARVSGSTAVTQGVHVRAVKCDPCAHLIGSTDGPVTGDKDIDVDRHALQQPQPNEVVLDRTRGVHVGERNQELPIEESGIDPARPGRYATTLVRFS